MSVSTSKAISPDSGEHWTEPGAFRVAEGIHRIPLPLPMDGLRAVNVYAVETPSGLTLVDGGWAIPEAREALEKGLAVLGAGVGDITEFLVTHAHRDHYSLAAALGTEVRARVVLGSGERGALAAVRRGGNGAIAQRLRTSGALPLVERWSRIEQPTHDPAHWRDPEVWLEGDTTVAVGERSFAAIPTPGHTQGHYVYADHEAGLLFAGDHVLPTITPSIGFEPVNGGTPLRDFMASLTRMRALPDLRLLPAHGPVAPSVHARVDELLEHHEHRLALSLAVIRANPSTAYQVAAELPWTRHEHRFDTLDLFNGSLAVMETLAHLDVLVARGVATRVPAPDGDLFSAG
ncbi:MBL fold metallo-hydrolase [Nocardioides sp. BP30]|uniref:MBL fold metallo-hydrolase n=1 Tax=Nocardioides sp. BP30 TaxID=3036374 RepID=UPI0024687DB9|nr:MBL fold metallo-hydrolase [Nocardioides sp. BP30]WGL52856.1 MBL fold metallo-hydrolase [Nocardioides sp. BP30]